VIMSMQKNIFGAPVKVWVIALAAILAFEFGGVSQSMLEGFAIGVTVGYVFLAE
jgi:hypothetical protein